MRRAPKDHLTEIAIVIEPLDNFSVAKDFSGTNFEAAHFRTAVPITPHRSGIAKTSCGASAPLARRCNHFIPALPQSAARFLPALLHVLLRIYPRRPISYRTVTGGTEIGSAMGREREWKYV